MDKELIRQLLPERPRPGMLQWALANCDDELGEQYLVYAPEKVPVYPDPVELITPGKWKPHHYERMARCTCLQCGHEFHTILTGNTLEFWIDDCGEWWPLNRYVPLPCDDSEDPEEAYENGYTVEVNEGDNLPCPMCQCNVHVIHKRSLRGGRRKQILVVSVEVVGSYTAVVYWLVWRDILDDGNDYGVFPRDAYVINERGTLVHYAHTQGGGAYCCETDAGYWRLSSKCNDTIDKPYYDWGNICNRAVGAMSYPEVPDITGTTGEKTGLTHFCKGKIDAVYTVSYLKLWKKYRKIENLVNTGWLKLVDDLVSMYHRMSNIEASVGGCVDLMANKPFEMLHMTKADLRRIRAENGQWDYEVQRVYMQYRESGFESAVAFMECVRSFTVSGIRAVGELQRLYGDVSFEKVARYLEKQNIQPREVGILLDTRNMAKTLAGRRQLTAEELWPRNLASAHDRLTMMRVASIDEKTAEKYRAGFEASALRYRDLEWNDKDLCVVLPRCNADLIREGIVLRHCVGGYGADHIAGHHVIFFIRHYRRPERCFYTLDINMERRPYRQQLHGYGNERHGIHKEYRHSIPQKVLDFCDRWEREVLMPWYEKQQKSEKTERETA